MSRVKFHTVDQPDSDTMIYHKHHIIPKHMGGTDDPSNLVSLTIEEHAEAHRLLFEQYGRWEDELAWKGLTEQISKDEILRRTFANQLGKKRPQEVTDKIVAKQKGQKRSEETKARMREANKTRDTSNIGKYVRTDEHKKKMSEAKRKNIS
jgi:hypothetical protein